MIRIHYGSSELFLIINRSEYILNEHSFPKNFYFQSFLLVKIIIRLVIFVKDYDDDFEDDADGEEDNEEASLDVQVHEVKM